MIEEEAKIEAPKNTKIKHNSGPLEMIKNDLEMAY